MTALLNMALLSADAKIWYQADLIACKIRHENKNKKGKDRYQSYDIDASKASNPKLTKERIFEREALFIVGFIKQKVKGMTSDKRNVTITNLVNKIEHENLRSLVVRKLRDKN